MASASILITGCGTTSGENGEVLAYLRAENAYKERQLAAVKPLEDKLYAEIIARLKQDDATVPYRKNGYWYYTRFEPGKEHPIFARRKASLDAPEQILWTRTSGLALATGPARTSITTR